MNEQLIIQCVKYMLRDTRPHAVIRLTMFLIEQAGKTSPTNPIPLDSEHPFLKNHFDKVGERTFVADLMALATLSSPEMVCKIIEEHEKTQVYEFSFSYVKAYFSLPVKQGRLTVVKKGDKMKHKIERVWARWFNRIGSRKDIYGSGVKLTKARSNAIENALNVRSEENLYDVIEGCLRSTHHMGFTIDRKTGRVNKTKRFCCPITIFRNEKIMDGLLSRLSEPMFDIQVEDANRRHSLRSFTVDAGIGTECVAPAFTPEIINEADLGDSEPTQPNLMQLILQGNFEQEESSL
ncbi:hypothetical protein OTK49_26765 [Vibrio coralliirubri]|uniref:hypothetical protein n=1 Tax=Vibrio coralliirubri TaxID=1516159 RepID=UPI002285272E|nr:hypothetical protein [Vibrio coralliirubri]MCY9866144.1 hypothetical protein [Vibrio coralliirubri]